jgi:hypothetical protein
MTHSIQHTEETRVRSYSPLRLVCDTIFVPLCGSRRVGCQGHRYFLPQRLLQTLLIWFTVLAVFLGLGTVIIFDQVFPLQS